MRRSRRQAEQASSSQSPESSPGYQLTVAPDGHFSVKSIGSDSSAGWPEFPDSSFNRLRADSLGACSSIVVIAMEAQQRGGEWKCTPAQQIHYYEARTKASIARVMLGKTRQLEQAYNGRLAHVPHMRGRVTVRFAIDQAGGVCRAEIAASALQDAELEAALLRTIASCWFGPICAPGDVTEVIYPFEFER